MDKVEVIAELKKDRQQIIEEIKSLRGAFVYITNKIAALEAPGKPPEGKGDTKNGS